MCGLRLQLDFIIPMQQSIQGIPELNFRRNHARSSAKKERCDEEEDSVESHDSQSTHQCSNRTEDSRKPRKEERCILWEQCEEEEVEAVSDEAEHISLSDTKKFLCQFHNKDIEYKHVNKTKFYCSDCFVNQKFVYKYT